MKDKNGKRKMTKTEEKFYFLFLGFVVFIIILMVIIRQIEANDKKIAEEKANKILLLEEEKEKNTAYEKKIQEMIKKSKGEQKQDKVSSNTSTKSHGRISKSASPACPTPDLVSDFLSVWRDSTIINAMTSYPQCKFMTKGAPINATIESNWAYVKVSWIDLGGHTRVSWIIREAVY